MIIIEDTTDIISNLGTEFGRGSDFNEMYGSGTGASDGSGFGYGIYTKGDPIYRNT